MKEKIVKQVVDIDNLNRQMEFFEHMNNQYAYLIMSKDTVKKLIAELESPVPDGVLICKNYGILYEYRGRKVFIDDDLEYGIVDIR